MIEIDGSFGEGGGQIVRTSLALSGAVGSAVRLFNIRASRPKPGLRNQHLTAVRAAAEVTAAELRGATLHSRELIFEPHTVRAGEYRFDVGTAGSTTLVLQTVLPILLTAEAPSRLTLEGGTHNPFAPPFEFLDRAFLPLINRTGPRVTAKLDRPGFYPAGGGKIRLEIQPARRPQRLSLNERGPILDCRATAVVSRLPLHIAERELAVVGRRLSLKRRQLSAVEETRARGPGNVLLVEVESKHLTEVFVGFGQRGVKAETVAERVAREAAEYREADVPVGCHLADQLLLPLSLGAGGEYATTKPTTHTTTNIEVIGRFLDVSLEVIGLDENRYRVAVSPRPPEA